MSDLVERILNRIHDAPIPTERLLDDAAEEIIELRQLASNLNKDWNKAYLEIESLRTQLATARKALAVTPEKVAAVQMAISKHPHFNQGAATAFGFANAAIRAALKLPED